MDAIQITAQTARNIRRLLTVRNMSQAALARDSGIQAPHISTLLSGGKPTSLETVAKVATALGVSPDKLLGPPLVPLFANPTQCGSPPEWADAGEPPAEWLNLSTFFGPPDELFLVIARGDSMTGVGVSEGDYLVIRRRDAGEVGQRVLALVAGGAVLKELAMTRRGLVLRSKPSGTKAHTDISVGPDATVLGHLVGVLRRERS